MSIAPYSFEPAKKKVSKKGKRNENESDDEWEDVSSNDDEPTLLQENDHVDELLEKINRLDVNSTEWCKCNLCVVMPVNRECLCCAEVDEIRLDKLSSDVTCITLHEGFKPVVLNKYVLWAALVSLNDRECAWLPPKDNIPNRSYRYAAYRQFSWFIYTKLGRYVRRIIPACVVNLIRNTYPEPNGEYVSFKDGDEGVTGTSEVVEAWEYL